MAREGFSIMLGVATATFVQMKPGIESNFGLANNPL
jgi:hypothetical protein